MEDIIVHTYDSITIIIVQILNWIVYILWNCSYIVIHFIFFVLSPTFFFTYLQYNEQSNPKFLEYNWNSLTNIYKHTYIFIIHSKGHKQYTHTLSLTLKWIYWFSFNLFAFNLLFSLANTFPFINICLQYQCNERRHNYRLFQLIHIHTHRLQFNF